MPEATKAPVPEDRPNIAPEQTAPAPEPRPQLPGEVEQKLPASDEAVPVPEPNPSKPADTENADTEPVKVEQAQPAGKRNKEESDKPENKGAPSADKQPAGTAELEKQPASSEDKPDAADGEAAPPEGADVAPPADAVPIPEPKPAAPEPVKPPRPPDPRAAMRPDPSGKMPPEELQCRAALKELGVAFDEHPAESDAATGCAIPYPIMMKSLGSDIALSAPAELNCTMALAAARFMKDVVSPAAVAEYKAGLKGIGHASAYVCRPRHGQQKISEHAFGNALDIASFTLGDGTRVDVKPDPDEKAARFLGTVRKAACGPFKTVLGPGSDADHALHFHLDLEPRRNGGTFCQ